MDAASLAIHTAGPASGGTSLLLAGAFLSGGSDYRCRFTNSSGHARVEPARLEALAVSCFSSMAAGLSPQPETLQVTAPLGGQHRRPQTQECSC